MPILSIITSQFPNLMSVLIPIWHNQSLCKLWISGLWCTHLNQSVFKVNKDYFSSNWNLNNHCTSWWTSLKFTFLDTTTKSSLLRTSSAFWMIYLKNVKSLVETLTLICKLKFLSHITRNLLVYKTFLTVHYRLDLKWG